MPKFFAQSKSLQSLFEYTPSVPRDVYRASKLDHVFLNSPVIEPAKRLENRTNVQSTPNIFERPSDAEVREQLQAAQEVARTKYLRNKESEQIDKPIRAQPLPFVQRSQICISAEESELKLPQLAPRRSKSVLSASSSVQDFWVPEQPRQKYRPAAYLAQSRSAKEVFCPFEFGQRAQASGYRESFCKQNPDKIGAQLFPEHAFRWHGQQE